MLSIFFSNALGKGQVRDPGGLQHQHLDNSYYVDNHKGRIVKQHTFTYLVLILWFLCLNIPLQKIFGEDKCI